VNCSFRYSRADLPVFKEYFRSRAIVELNFDCGESFAEIVQGYQAAVDILAPEVIAVPLAFLNETWTEEAVTELYSALRTISERFAREMRWIGE
jgi:hypothetical protein